MSSASKALTKKSVISELSDSSVYQDWAGNRLYTYSRKGTQMYVKQRPVFEMVIIFILYVYYHLRKAEVGLSMEISSVDVLLRVHTILKMYENFLQILRCSDYSVPNLWRT